MAFFNLFLPTTGLLLSFISMGVCYWIVSRCKQGQFIPIYYFLAFALVSTIGMSASRITEVLFGAEFLNAVLIQDLMISWTALFLFGALWQSYEASICVVPERLRE